MHIYKTPLPKGMSFVLKSSQLEAVLKVSGLLSVETTFNLHNNQHILFRAYFWPGNRSLNKWIQHDRFYLIAGMVPSHEAYEKRMYVLDQVLPEFVAWAKNLLSYDRQSTHRINASVFMRS